MLGLGGYLNPRAMPTVWVIRNSEIETTKSSKSAKKEVEAKGRVTRLVNLPKLFLHSSFDAFRAFRCSNIPILGDFWKSVTLPPLVNLPFHEKNQIGIDGNRHVVKCL